MYLANNSLAISIIAVKWHLQSAGTGSTVSTKNKDHARDEEFRGRTSSHLEQFASHAAIGNSLPIDVCSTSEGHLVHLTDSASEDYLSCTLQIYSVIIIISVEAMEENKALKPTSAWTSSCLHLPWVTPGGKFVDLWYIIVLPVYTDISCTNYKIKQYS